MRLSREQRAQAHRAEASVRILAATAARELRPLWREHIVAPLITRALGKRKDAEDTPDKKNQEPIYQWFVANGERIVKTQARLQQGTLGIKADAHSPRVQKALMVARDNARALIVSASNDLEQDLDDILLDPDNFGLRVEALRDLLMDRGNVSESRAELIARDQTMKTNAAISRAGHEDAGYTQYIWSTSMDERVRPEHSALEGQVFSYSDPPDEGNPGDPVNCRCVALPYEEAEES